MEAAPHTEAQWQAFRTRSAAFAHASHVVRAFDGLISAETASQLAAEERFCDRLSILLAELSTLSDDLGTAPPSVPSRRLASASSAELAALVRRFGAVYWARAIVGTIESAAVVALKQTLGEDAYAAALAHRDLAGGERVLPAWEDLDGAVTSAGLCCLAAWCARQPVGLAQRIRLKLPHDTAFDEPVTAPFDQAGPAIVDRLLA
jgi:hypothetical protein